MFSLEMTVSARGHRVTLSAPLDNELALSDAMAEAAALLADQMGVPLARIELGIALADRMEDFAKMACPSVSVSRAGFLTAVAPDGEETDEKTITIKAKGEGAGTWFDFATKRQGDAYDLAEWAFGDQAPHTVAQFLEVRPQGEAAPSGVLDLDTRRRQKAPKGKAATAKCPACHEPVAKADACERDDCPVREAAKAGDAA